MTSICQITFPNTKYCIYCIETFCLLFFSHIKLTKLYRNLPTHVYCNIIIYYYLKCAQNVQNSMFK